MRDILLTALAPVTWGTTYIVATQFLPADRPLFVGVVRALPVGLLLLICFRRLPQGDWRWRAFVLGALNIGVFFALLFTAAYRLPGGVVATVGALQPFMVAPLAWAFLGEQVSRRLIVAACAGLIGVGLVVLNQESHFDAVGVAAALAATTTWAGGTVLTKRWGRPAPLLVFTAWQLVAGGLLLLPAALVVEGMPPELSTPNVVGFVYLGVVGTGLAYALWFRGVGRLKASMVVFLGLLSPVSAIMVDLLILRRAMNIAQVCGVVLVLTSIFATQTMNQKVSE